MMSIIKLHDFQQQAITSAVTAWGKGLTSILISAPTGAGKTVIFSSLLKQLTAENEKRGLVLVHRDTLLQQSIDTISYVWPGAQIGRIQGKQKEFNKKITVASIPTLSGCIKDMISATETYGDISFCIIDESHHALAATWKGIADAFKNTGKTKILGVTATPIRTKKSEDLKTVFEEMVYSISIFQLIQDGLLSPLVGLNVHLNDLHMENVRTLNGDYLTSDLSKVIDRPDFRKVVVNEWKDKAYNRRTICFAVDVNHVNNLVDDFNKVGARAVGIHGKMKQELQRSILKRFTIGEYNVLVNCMLLTEGYDNKKIDTVLCCRPTKSKALYIQMVGRGLRLSPETGKTECLLIDFTPSSNDTGMIGLQDLLSFYGIKNIGRVAKKITITKENISSLKRANVAFGVVPSSTSNNKTAVHKKNSTKAKEAKPPTRVTINKDTVPDGDKEEDNRPDEGQEGSDQPSDNEIVVSPADIPERVIPEITKQSVEYTAISLFDMDKFAWTEVDGSYFVSARLNLVVVILKEDEFYTPYLIFNAPKQHAITQIASRLERDFATAIASVYLHDYGDRAIAYADAKWRSKNNTDEQAVALKKAIIAYKRKHPGTDLNIDVIRKTSGIYSDTINALNSLAQIEGRTLKPISLEAAQERLKNMVIVELQKKNRQYGDKYPRVQASRFYDVKLAMKGCFDESDRINFREILITLANDKYADFTTNFIEKNKIEFADDTITVKQTEYPPYPITENQKQLLRDRINMVFRLFYREKSLEISEAIR